MKKMYAAKTASRGIAIAPVYLYQEPELTADQTQGQVIAADVEKEKFDNAKEQVIAELEKLASENEVFAAHMEIAGDFTLTDRVFELIDGGDNAQMAVERAIQELVAVFESMDDAYMRERATDMKDVGKRLLAALKGVSLPDLGTIDHEVILVAKDLFPSDTIKINPQYVCGIITEQGGITSHVSIFAKNKNIPILVGVKGILDSVQDGVLVCMDAESGEIIIDSTREEEEQYRKKQEAYADAQEKRKQLRTVAPMTKDGRRIRLCANAGNTQDVKNAVDMCADGIGLFRSESLYMEKDHFPTEDEQFEVYRKAAELMPQELTIRTLDIGGDKTLPYYTFEKEDNPFLGWRAIRISLEMKDMFKQQLRAILRASHYGHIRIMFPMIISMEELTEAKRLVEECKEELRKQDLPFDEQIETGMMMETPASVMLAEQFAKEADFFSIGTNDLTQYMLAVDRGNKKIAAMYDSFHPAVLAAIGKIIEAAHKEHITVGMCGEMAGDPKAVPVLLQMGLDEFSVSASSLDYTRELILEN